MRHSKNSNATDCVNLNFDRVSNIISAYCMLCSLTGCILSVFCFSMDMLRFTNIYDGYINIYTHYLLSLPVWGNEWLTFSCSCLWLPRRRSLVKVSQFVRSLVGICCLAFVILSTFYVADMYSSVRSYESMCSHNAQQCLVCVVAMLMLAHSIM